MTIPFDPDLLAKCATHAWEAPEVEVCGYIHNGEYHRTPNLSLAPTDGVVGDLPDLENITFFHSHPKGPDDLTLHDSEAAIATQTPYLVFSLDPIGWAYFDPEDFDKAAYADRPYLYGVYDCYTLVQHYLKNELGCTISDYPRRYSGEWEQEGWDVFDKEWRKYGDEVMTPQKGDVLLLSTGDGSRTDHLGVFDDDAYFYHHPIGRPSLKSLYGNYWKNRTIGFVRPRSVS